MGDETPTQNQTSATETPNTETVNGEVFDAQRAMNTIKTLRDELKTLKVRAKTADELEAAEKRRQQETLSETERLKAQLAEAQKAIEDTSKARDDYARAVEKANIEGAILAAAGNFNDPSDVLALIDRASIQVKDGKVIGVKDAIEALGKQKPHLLKRMVPLVGATNPGGNGAVNARGETDFERRRRLGLA